MADQDDSDKLYKCGHCGLTSVSIDELKLHMINAHLNEAGTVDVPSDNNEAVSISQDVEVAMPMVQNQGIPGVCNSTCACFVT